MRHADMDAAVTITNRVEGMRVPRKALERAAAAAVRAAGRRGVVLSVAVVGDAEMERLNERFLGRRLVTDVLSFELEPTSPDPAEPAGEVVVNGELARREARSRGRPTRDELALYVVHGVLHLFGFDDLTRDGARAMKMKESEILSGLGLGSGR